MKIGKLEYLSNLMLAWSKSQHTDDPAYPRAVLQAALRFRLNPREVYAAVAEQLDDRTAFPSYEEIGPPGT